MSSLNKELVQQKLADLTQYLDELSPLSTGSFDEYREDYVKRHAVEKLIELIVEIATDVNRHIIEVNNDTMPPTYFSTFAQMGELKILPKDLSARLASTTGLRNRLVHGYEKIEHKIVYRNIVPFLKDYQKFLVVIYDYLQTK